jgi:AcrR family transcriptional regulator
MVYSVYMTPTSQRIAAAARHVLGREGAEAVTMRRVAEAVGITPMALYRHYPNRDGLLNSLADEGFEELAAELSNQRFSGDFETQLIKMADIFLEHALKNPRLFELMFLKPRSGARRYPRDFKAGYSPTATPMAEVVQQGMDHGYFRKDDVWEIVFELGALSHGLIMLYFGGRIGTTPAKFRQLYRRSFRRYIHGIRK